MNGGEKVEETVSISSSTHTHTHRGKMYPIKKVFNLDIN